MKNLTDIDPCEIIFEKDMNGRRIDLYNIKNVQSYGNGFYPNCFFAKADEVINLSTEKVMSLKDIDFSFNGEQTSEPENVEENPVFYFVYNTENYYHFVYDTLPYLISYFKIKESIPNIKLLMNFPNSSYKMYRFVTEFLELLDITEEDILIIDNKTAYANLYVSSSYTHGHDSNLPPRKEIYDLYKSLISKAKEKYDGDISNLPKKIYISRRTWVHGDTSNIGTNYTTRRKLEEEDGLVEMLLSDGFSEIFAERLSTIEKIVLFNNAEIVIGAIGGGICNALFGERTCKLISIVSPTFLSINGRFRYCFEQVETFYYDNTSHSEIGRWKKWMRVKCQNIIGEIEEVLENDLIVSYTDEIVAGWNSKTEYKKIRLRQVDCVELDNGLNSAWRMDLNDFYTYKNQINDKNRLK